MLGQAIIAGQNQSNKANINDCTTGIRLSDTTANIHYIEFTGCATSIMTVGIPTTPVMYNIYVPSGGKGLVSVAYAVPRLYYSEISSSITSNSIHMYQSGNLDIDGENNNIYDPPANYAIYIASTCPDIYVDSNYWGSSQPIPADLFSDPSKILDFAGNYLTSPYPYAGKEIIPGNEGIATLFDQAREYEIAEDYETSAALYKNILSQTTDTDSRTKSLRLMYGSLLNGGLPLNNFKSLINNEIPATTGKNAMLLRYLLGDAMLKEGRYHEAIDHFRSFMDMYKDTSAEVDALVKLAIIYGNYLGDKTQAREYATHARNLNPGHASLPDAFSSAGIAYTALASENKYFDTNDDFDTLKPAEPQEEAGEVSELTVSVAPNPANPVTTLYYSITASERVKLDIYSLSGQKVVIPEK